MPNKTKKKKSGHYNKVNITIIVLAALCIALFVGLYKQAKIISQYDLLSQLDNQACRYLADRGSDSRINGGFRLNTDANENDPKLTYYCYTGEIVKSKTIHGKPINGYSLGAVVSYFSSNETAETYAKEKLNPLRYWSDDGSDVIQNKNYTFLVTDEKESYFDAYRVRANAVVRVSLPCKNNDYDACDMQAHQLLDQELKGINAL